jgi:hypothetical protein
VQIVVIVGIILTTLAALVVFARRVWPLLVEFMETVVSLQGFGPFMKDATETHARLEEGIARQGVILKRQTSTLAKQGATLAKQGATLAKQDVTLAEQGETLSEIHHEVHFNNGSSVKDVITRVENNQKTVIKNQKVASDTHARLEEGIKGLYDRTEELERGHETHHPKPKLDPEKE